MVAKTDFSKEELKKIISDYDLGKLLESKPFKTGYVQTNILLKTTKGKFVLRYYEHRSKEYVKFEVDILYYFSRHKYPCAMPIRNVHGKYMGKYKKKYYAIFEFIPGKHVKNLSKQQYVEMVKYLAKLHNISRGYKPKYFEFRESHDKKYCIETAKVEAKRFKLKKIAKERYSYLVSQLNSLKFPNNLPKGVVHCDFDKANIKFKGNKVVGILDFDDACYTYLVFDVGMLLYYWAWKHEKKFNFTKAKKIIRVYEKYRKLSEYEKAHIFDAIQMVVLTFMAWFFYDKWKGVDVFKKSKKKLEEINKIGRKEFHNILFN